jgi:hypothetical protein
MSVRSSLHPLSLFNERTMAAENKQRLAFKLRTAKGNAAARLLTRYY